MNNNEIIIHLRASAEGVKKGVEAAKKSLEGLKKEKKLLEEELHMKVHKGELNKLKEELSSLQKRKEILEGAISFPVDSERISEMKMKLSELNNEKNKIEAMLSIPMDLSSSDELKSKLEEISSKAKELERKISIEVEIESSTASSELSDIKRKISYIERSIQIEASAVGIGAVSAQLKEVAIDIEAVKEKSSGFSERLEAALPAAGAVFSAVSSGVKTGLDTFSEYSTVMNNLSANMLQLGISSSAAMDIVQQKSADGFLSVSDAAEAIKNLTQYGYTLYQASEMVDRLKDSAVNNRQSQYTLSEAVKATTEGIKNGNSALAEASGVTKPLSKMYEEYALSLGKTAESLTEAEKAQATYNGFMKETESFMGNAATYADTLAGSQEQLKSSVTGVAAAFGEALAPVAIELMQSLTSILNLVREFILENKETVVTLTALAGGIAGVIVAIGKAQAAVKGIGAIGNLLSLNPAIAPLVGVAGAIGLVISMVSDAHEKTIGFNEEFDKVKGAADGFRNAMKFGVDEENIAALKEGREGLDLLVERLDTLGKVNKSIADAGGDDFSYTEGKILNFAKEVEKYGITLSGVGSAEEQRLEMLAKLNSARSLATVKEQNYYKAVAENKAVILAQSMDMEKLSQSIKETAERLEFLEQSQKALSQGQDLSAETLNKLIDLYPKVAEYIASTGDLTLKNGEILSIVAAESRKLATDTLNAEREKTENVIKGTKNRIAAMESELTMLLALQLAQGDTGYDVEEINKTIKQRTIEIESAKETVAKETVKLDQISKSMQEYGSDSSKGENKKALSSGSGGISSGYVEKTNSELQKQLKIIDDIKATSEMSAEEEIQRLRTILAEYELTKEEAFEIEKRLFPLRKALGDKLYKEEMDNIEKLNKGREDNTDFSAIIEAYKKLFDEIPQMYEGLPITIGEKQKEVMKLIEDNTRNLADKISGIGMEALDNAVSLHDKYINNLKQFNGMTLPDGTEYEFGPAEEKILVGEWLEAINKDIDDFVSQYGDKTDKMTNGQKEQYEDLLQLQQDYNDRHIALSLEAIKEEERNMEEQRKIKLQALEELNRQIIAKEKEQTSKLIEEIKTRYSEEIKFAEEAANAEISAYEEKIKAIDNLLKEEERKEEDDKYSDKINRLRGLLEFETDDSNKYEMQKEIDNLTAENDKRKRKESLEDEKAMYQEQINAVKENLAEQKLMLEENRDAEIAFHEEALESYTAKLEAELEGLKGNNEQNLEELKKNYENQEKEYKTFLDGKKVKTQENNLETEALMDSSSTNIINRLYERVEEYREAGKRAGDAYAEAFRESVQSIESQIDDRQYSVLGAQASTMSTNATNNSIQLYQSISSPTASPSKVARESKKALESALRYV